MAFDTIAGGPETEFHFPDESRTLSLKGIKWCPVCRQPVCLRRTATPAGYLYQVLCCVFPDHCSSIERDSSVAVRAWNAYATLCRP